MTIRGGKRVPQLPEGGPRIRRVGVVVPTADAKQPMTQACVEAVHRTTRGFEVDLQLVESGGPDFRFSRSVNQGMRASKDADAWVLLNDDAVMDAGWLDALVGTAHAHPHVGLVGAVLRYPDGGLQHAGGYLPLSPVEYVTASVRHRAPFWALRRIRANAWKSDFYMFGHWHSVWGMHRLDFLTAACVLITRPCRERVGDYDEEYIFGCEDVDYSLRALDQGFELALATRATGVHHESRTAGGSLHLKGEPTFRSKWTPEHVRRLTRTLRIGRGVHSDATGV